MKHSTNFNMNLPESTDFFSADHQNQNIEIIDAELDKLYQYHKNTYYSSTGTQITCDKAEELGAIQIKKITGATTVTPADPTKDISPANIATLIGAKDFQVKANDSGSSENSITVVGEYNSVNGISDSRELVDGVLKKIQRIGKYTLTASDVYAFWTSGTVNIDYVSINLSKLSGILIPTTTDIQGTSVITSKTSPRNGATQDSLSTVNKHWKTTSLLNIAFEKGKYANLAEAQAAYAGTVVLYVLATPIETILSDNNLLTSYNGITNVLTTASPQVQIEVDFKSRLWYLDFKKIDKANIANNFVTTDPTMVAAAPTVKELREDVDEINTNLNSKASVSNFARGTTLVNVGPSSPTNTISFGKTFSSNPTVTISQRNNTAPVTYGIIDVYTTGFTVQASYPSVATISIDWIATNV